MRKLIYVVLLAIVCFGCEPQIKSFTVQPSSVRAGPASVAVNWRISVGDGELSADMPVTPSLNPPQKVNSQGSRVEQVCKTTTFKLTLPYGGESTAIVTVAQPCGAGCGQQILTFTGTCFSANQGPTYDPQTANPIQAFGNLQNLLSDADFPVHVQHAGADIAMSAGGGPLFPPVSAVPAAGVYNITVPGAVGMKVCADATGPLGGGQAPAPPVHITVIPTCPAP